MASAMTIWNRLNKGVWLTASLLFALALCPSTFAATLAYTYDTLNRLTQVDYGNGYIVAYTYDAAGNRLNSTSQLYYAVTASVSPLNSGTVVGAGNLANGSTAQITATPNTGYVFVNWTVNGSIVGTSATYTGTIAGPLALQANFALVTPQAFSFTAQTGVPISTFITSNSIAVAGITAAANISVTGGDYSLNGGAFTTASGTVLNNDFVLLRQQSSAAYATTTGATLTIGAASAVFNVTTALAVQTIGFSPLANQTLGAAPFTVSATASSGLPVAFSTTTNLICTVSGNTVTLVAQGTCTIAADQAGNGSYSSAPQVRQSFTVNAGSSSPQASLIAGWNLLGNSVNAPLTVASAFPIAPSTTNVSTVWKWLAASSQWAFYSPTLADGGAAYSQSKGYIPLTEINAGEGFWVNAKTAFILQLPAGTVITSTTFADQLSGINSLPLGWSLIATGDNPTPRSFANAIALSPPSAGSFAATSLTTLWAWDSALTSWYFYAPSLDNAGTLNSYITNKNYLDFTANGKLLDQTTGFWVNHP
jgi:YD repeat-containing protein